MAQMPSLRRPAVRLLLIAAVATAGLAVWPLSALAQFPGTEINLKSPSGDTGSVLLGDVEFPDTYGTYEIRQAGHDLREIKIKKGDGISIRQLLEEEGFDSGYGIIAIPRLDGSSLKLTREQINDPQYPPVFYLRNGKVIFLRPSTGPGDNNAQDHFSIGIAPVTLTQSRAVLKVAVKPSATAIDPGETVTFTASVTNGPDDATYVFHWDFKDGRPETTSVRRNTHTFKKRGTYPVLVTAKLAGASRSDAAPVVEIQVGDPEQDEKDRAGGGTNATGGADGGASDGAAGVGSTYGDGSSSSTYEPSTPSTPSTDPPLIPDIATSEPTISGNLLADVNDPPASSILESAAKAAREGTPKDDDEVKGAGVPEAAVAIAAVLALIGLGAGLELRLGRPRRAA